MNFKLSRNTPRTQAPPPAQGQRPDGRPNLSRAPGLQQMANDPANMTSRLPKPTTVRPSYQESTGTRPVSGFQPPGQSPLRQSTSATPGGAPTQNRPPTGQQANTTSLPPYRSGNDPQTSRTQGNPPGPQAQQGRQSADQFFGTTGAQPPPAYTNNSPKTFEDMGMQRDGRVPPGGQVSPPPYSPRTTGGVPFGPDSFGQ